ncbi:MAG TPA: hypothetical protein VF189_06115 [Patescibacteria group bacterium]
MEEKNGYTPQDLKKDARDISKDLGLLALKTASRFIFTQALIDSWQYSTATGVGPLRRTRNLFGALVGGLGLPGATAALQADLREIPIIGPAFKVPGVKNLAVGGMAIVDCLAWGGGALAFVPTAAYRLLVSAASEALPRREEIYNAGLRRSR